MAISTALEIMNMDLSIGQLLSFRILTILLLMANSVVGKVKELNLLVLLPFEIPGSQEQPSYTEGPILLPSVELAVDQINQCEDILSGYHINITVANTACNLKTYTEVNFVKSFFHSGVRFAGIVGPTCSDAAEIVSAITGQKAISILNFHITSSPRLIDRKRYGYSFGTAGSSHGYVGLFLQLMKLNNWQTIAIFYEESKIFYESAYSLLVEELPRVFPEGRIVFSSPISETYLPLSSITNHHVRVVFVLATSELAGQILCLINRVYPKLKFPSYQFVFMEIRKFYLHNSVNSTFKNYICSAREITQAMEGYLLTHINLNPVNKSTVLVSGITYKEYLEQYHQRVENSVENASTTEWADPTYDGVWSLALAINNSIHKLTSIGLDLSDYGYGHEDATNIIRDEVVGLNFQGASGMISFDNNTGFTNSTIDLHQVMDNVSILIGQYSEEQEALEIVGSPEFVENTFESRELLAHPALAALFLFFTAIALLLTITAHLLTLIYHKYKDIRASSYRLSQLSFIGCYIITISTVCSTVQKAVPTSSVNTTALCGIQAWCIPIGLTLILGTVTAKTWRLYRIFVHLRKPGKFLNDWVLIIAVLTLVTVDIVLCTVWTTVFPFTTERLETITGPNEIEVRVVCQSNSYFIWFITLTLYQGLIMFVAFTLSLLTKSIRHKSFKTKPVTFLVYFLTPTILLGSPTYLILQATGVYGVNAEYAVLSLTLNIILYLCFGFLFFPPLLSLVKEKLFHRLPGLKKFSKQTPVTYKPSSYCKN